MKSGHQKVALATCFLIAGVGGYCFQAVCDRPASAFTAREPAGVNYFITVQSFSEVDNARALMQALAVRSLQELRTRRISIRPAPPNSIVPDPVREQQSAELIRDFQAAIQEFAGTGQEISFVQDLLGMFKREGRYREWVSLFLEYAYRHPTQDVIGRMANEALTVAQAAHREQEVLTALRHLHDIPFEFAAKPAVESALIGTAGGVFLARSRAVVAADERRD